MREQVCETQSSLSATRKFWIGKLKLKDHLCRTEGQQKRSTGQCYLAYDTQIIHVLSEEKITKSFQHQKRK